MSNEKEYFTNFHSHRLFCNHGDKDKFSMLPIGELLPILEENLQNLIAKMSLVEYLEKEHPELMIDPLQVDTSWGRVEKQAVDWLASVLIDSKRLERVLARKGYKKVKSKLKKKKHEETLAYYTVNDQQFDKFINVLKAEGVIK